MSKQVDIVNIQDSMKTLFEVWAGTDNADDILKDVVSTIGHRVFNLEGDALDAFRYRCQP